MSALPPQEVIETVYEAYKERVLAIMVSIRDACRDAGLDADEAYDATADEYRWEMEVFYVEGGTRADAAIVLTIEEAAALGDEPEDGINFSVLATNGSGGLIASLAPYNYTPECWVSANDPNAVEDRFSILENMDWPELAEMIRRSIA